jgi:RimJ/RimL family protein N-acetyltransferase
MDEFCIGTERLILRAWRDEDVSPFHAMCNDPLVMEHLGPLQSPEDIDAAIARQRGFQRDFNCCFWAVERREDGAMLGFCGVKPGPAGTPIEDRLEIGWRLAADAWGKGYAREAALASLDHVWAQRDSDSVWAITTPGNARSWGLMLRLGMTRHEDLDFDHPALPADSPLLRHVTYSIARPS